MGWSFFGNEGRSDEQKPVARRSRKSRKNRGRRPLFEELEQRRVLAVLTVNSTDGGVGNDALLTLREAVAVVNNGSATGTIAGLGRALSAGEAAQISATSPFGTNDTVNFAAAQFPPATNTTISLAGGTAVDITRPVTITGNTDPSTIIIDAVGASRVFTIDVTAGNVTLSGLTMTNGKALVATDDGGAILSSTLGTLTVRNSIVTASTAGRHGGAIFTEGDLTLIDDKIGVNADGTTANGNTANTGDGGGVFSSENVTVQNSTISGNKASTGNGGGVFATISANVQNSIIGDRGGATPALGNTAKYGGGIYAPNVTTQFTTIAGNSATDKTGGGVQAVTAMILNSTVSDNTAAGAAGAPSGGGIFGQSTVILRNSTVFENKSAAGLGAGVWGAIVTLQNATVTENDATAGEYGGLFANVKMNIQNSIVAFNTSGAGNFPDINDAGAANSKVRFSIIGDIGNVANSLLAGQQFEVKGTTKNAFANFVGNGGALILDAKGVNSVFGGNAADPVALAFNDSVSAPSQTKTVALQTGSLAIDMGSNSLVVNAGQGDQRGLPYARISPFAGSVDMGAFEAQTATVANTPPAKVSDITTPQSATVGSAFTLPVAGNFSDADGDALTFKAARVINGVPQGPGSLPSWLTFDTTTGQFAGVPTAADIGQIQIQVTATDGKSDPATLPTSTFTLSVVATPVAPATELPTTISFEGPVVAPNVASDARIKVKVPSFATSTDSPIDGSQSLLATRPTVGSRPVATVDFNNPATAGSVSNVSVNVSTVPGNGTTVWSNAVIVFDYQSPTNYKFAGVFEIIDKLIIGQVVNGKVQYLNQKNFPAQPNTKIPLSISIDRTSKIVTLSSGATSLSHTFSSLGTGTVGVGTINANARFDSLAIS
jgi:hypothetical protein